MQVRLVRRRQWCACGDERWRTRLGGDENEKIPIGDLELLEKVIVLEKTATTDELLHDNVDAASRHDRLLY